MFHGRADSSRYRPRSLSTSIPANANAAVTGASPATGIAGSGRRESPLSSAAVTRIPVPAVVRPLRDNPANSSSSAASSIVRTPHTQIPSVSLYSSSHLHGERPSRATIPTTSVAMRAPIRQPAFVERAATFDEDDGNQGEPQADGHDDGVSSACSTAFVSGESHIITAVRVRPMFASERKSGCRRIIDMGVQTANTGNWTRIVNPISLPDSEGNSADDSVEMSSHSTQFTHDFHFDFSFWSYDRSPGRSFASQSMIYEELGTFAIDSAWEGYNCSIFAYGQTSAGKTFTMTGDTSEVSSAALLASGSRESPPGSYPRQGIIPRICRGLCDKMESARVQAQSIGHSCRFSVQVSYVEVYHEHVYDLLVGSAPSGKESLKVRENPEDGVYVENAKSHSVMSFEDIKTLVDEGNRVRSVAATNLNQRSSRSHAILTLYVKQHSPSVRISAASLTNTSWMGGAATEKIAGLTIFAKKSKICLVDLAGSERADISGASGQRLKEAGSINRSLSTLADVISALSKRSSVLTATAGHGASSNFSAFIPYRNSVLTRLLKESLGGNAKTVMLAAISPCCVHYEETLSTLKYIERAKSVVNSVKVNTENGLELVQELRREISELKARLQSNTTIPVPNSLEAPSQSNSLVPKDMTECDIPDDTMSIPTRSQPLPSTLSSKTMGPEEDSNDSSPQYPTICFSEADKAKLEREIAKLKMQLKKKDKELQQQQFELTSMKTAGNQRHQSEEERIVSAVRKQALLLNLLGTHRRLIFQRRARAFERWRASNQAAMTSNPLVLTSPARSSQDVSSSSDGEAPLSSSLEDLAALGDIPRKNRSASGNASGVDACTLHTICSNVVDSILFSGQLQTDTPVLLGATKPLEVVDEKFNLALELNPLEALAGRYQGEEVDIMNLSQATDICLSPFDSACSSFAHCTSSGSDSAILTLELSDVSDFELDRALKESIDAAAAAVEAFEDRQGKNGISCRQQRSPLRGHRISTALAKYKQQVQARITRCLDVLDMARKCLGPTDRMLRKRHESCNISDRGGLTTDPSFVATATERQLLRYTERCLMYIVHQLEDFRTTISGYSPTSKQLVEGNAFDKFLQCKVALYERVEALLTVFCLHILRRVCDQMCAPVTMALRSPAESIREQLSSFQDQLIRPELWRDTLASGDGTTTMSWTSMDQPVALTLLHLFGISERIKATSASVDQKHRLLEVHLRTQQNLRQTTDTTMRKITTRSNELERALRVLEEQHASVQNELLSRQNELVVASSQVQEVECRLASMTEQWECSERDRVSVRDANAVLSEEKAGLEQQVSSLSALKTSLQQQVSVLRDASDELRVRESASQEEVSRLCDEVCVARARVRELEAKQEELEASWLARETELCVRLEGEASAAVAGHAAASSRVSELEGALRVLEEQHASVQNELLSRQCAWIDYRTENEILQGRISEMEAQWTFAAEMQREAVARLDVVDEERRELVLSLESTEERYSTLASEFWAQSLLLARVEDDLGKARSTEAKAIADLAVRERQFASLLVARTIDITNHTSEVCCLRDELRSVRAHATRLNEELVEMTAKHLVEYAVSKQLEADAERAAEQIGEWTAKYEAVSTTYVTQRAELFQSEAEVKALRQQLSSLESGDNDLDSDHRGKQSEHVERLEESLREAESRYNSLRTVCGDADSVDWEGKYNGLMSDMHVRIQELQEQLDEMTARAAEWESRSIAQPTSETEDLQIDGLPQPKDASSKAGSPAPIQGEVLTQQLVLKHLNSLDAWFSDAIVHEERTPAKENERRLGSIVDTKATRTFSDGEEVEEVWSVLRHSNNCKEMVADESHPAGKPRQVVDASTETDSAPLDAARPTSGSLAISQDASPPLSELAQLRTTILKLKATIDEKEGMIQFMDERLSYFESLRFK